VSQGRNFPDFIEAYLQYTKNQEASEKIHKWVAISVLAAALQRKVWLPRGHYTLFPNLYIFIIGASGVVRKSTSTGIGVDLLRSLEKFHIMSERLTAAALIQNLEASHEIYQWNGKEKHQSASFAYASELIVFLREVYGSISELLTTFYDCSPHDDSKPWTYETKGEGQKRIFGPCLNILGASTPQWLSQAIPPDQMEGGFTSRVIFVVENEEPKRFIAWPDELASGEQDRLKKRLEEDLQAVNRTVGEVRVSAEAREWFRTWYEEHMKSLIKAQDLRFSGYYGRKADTLLKIAMVCAASSGHLPDLDTSHLKRAAALLEELELSMFQAFGTAGTNDLAPVMDRVLRFITVEAEKGGGRVPHSLILRKFWNDLSNRDLTEIMQTLIGAGVVAVESASGGKVIYRVLPVVPPAGPPAGPGPRPSGPQLPS
jgi:hypothetical protein